MSLHYTALWPFDHGCKAGQWRHWPTIFFWLDKDEKYWEKRLKNKQATRRSREAKRLKENQIVLRAAFLEKENKVLKGVGKIKRIRYLNNMWWTILQELENTYLKKSKLETEIKILNMKIQRHESGKLKFSV